MDNLEKRILDFQKYYVATAIDEDDPEFKIIGSPKELKYIIKYKDKNIFSLSIIDLKELKNRTGEEPFIRFYFLKSDRDVWEYFEDKNIAQEIENYSNDIVSALMSYSLSCSPWD